MKSFITKFTIGFVTMLAAFVVFAAPALASSTTLNQDSGDLKTLRVSNWTAAPNSVNWSSSVNTGAGQIVAVDVYYHNSGTETAHNVRIKLSPKTDAASTSHTFNVTITSDNSNVVTDTATVNVDTAQSLSFITGGVYWYPNQECKNNPGCQPQSLPGGQSGSELFTTGFNLGDLAPGWSTQGGLAVHFQVSNNGGNNPTAQLPSVTTNIPSGLDSLNGNVTLQGYFNSNGSATSTSFRYRLDGGSWMTTPSVNQGIVNGQQFNYALTGLPSGNYTYEAVATNAAGTVYGNDQTFSINSGNNNQYCQSGYTGTYPNCVPVQQYCGSGYYGTYPNCYPINNNQYCQSGYTGTYPNCYPINNNQYCQSGYTGTYPNCYPIQNTNTLPSISTLGTISVGGTIAVVDGYFSSTTCAVTTNFNYGTTQSLGQSTGSVSRGVGSGSMAQALSNLAPNTTYYYQAVGTSCAGTSTGTVRSFRTSGTTTNDTTITRYVTVSTGGGGSSFIKLMIDNHRDVVRANVDTAYNVSWTNLTGTVLKNLVLEINFPSQMTITDTDRGAIETKKSAVVYQISSLDAHETGEMTISGTVLSGLKDGDPVVAQAVMAFENPKTTATENAIAYDADTFSLASGSVLGASLFGIGFLPNSLIGWLIILLIILIIVLIARHYWHKPTQNVVVHTQAPIAPIVSEPAGAQPGDYVVYRPTPNKQ